MKASKLNPMSNLGIACGLLLVSGSVVAQVVVPFADPAPLVCTTANFSVEAITGMNGEYPITGPCNTLVPSEGLCSNYGYTITSLAGKNIDHTLFAVSADQLVYATYPSATVTLPPGVGDSTTGFLAYAQHEYPVRFNSNGTTYNSNIFIKGSSSPRISTALIKSGKAYESCLIAGPGVAGDPFQPKTQTEATVVAGGKCEITKIFDASGKLVDITLASGSDCHIGRPTEVSVNGEKLQNNTSRDGITFGSNTTTCYGPPTPKTPLCVCTATPCPY